MKPPQSVLLLLGCPSSSEVVVKGPGWEGDCPVGSYCCLGSPSVVSDLDVEIIILADGDSHFLEILL